MLLMQKEVKCGSKVKFAVGMVKMIFLLSAQQPQRMVSDQVYMRKY